MTRVGHGGEERTTHPASEAELRLRPGISEKAAVAIPGGGAVLGGMQQELSGMDDDGVCMVWYEPGAAEPALHLTAARSSAPRVQDLSAGGSR